MNNLVAAVREFLSGAQFEISAREKHPFVFIAQNRSTIVFGVEVIDDLESVLDVTLTRLASPFRNKSFGPKTMEMYVVFISGVPISLPGINKCERDTRICRKLVITPETDVPSRLSFLAPLDDIVTLAPDVERMFWVELEKHLNGSDVESIRRLREGVSAEEEIIRSAEDES